MDGKVQKNEPGLFTRLANTTGLFFGGLAVVVTHCVTVDPWLCAPAFRRVCLFGFIFEYYSKVLGISAFH